MTVAEPPNTVPNSPDTAPDREGEGQIDQNVRYDENGFYLYTIGGPDDPSRDT
jgi:hypothetical protein